VTDSVRHAVDLLRKGQLVAFPTETVYGLGADATNADAVRNIFAVKQRPANVPLTIHIGTKADPSDWAEISSDARRLMDQFWPGPLTLILPKTNQVLDIVVASGSTVGLRMPNHPLCIELLNAFGGGVAAPSANRHRALSPTSAKHVRDDFGDEIPCILDGGHSPIGLESTVLSLAGPTPILLRPGSISLQALEQTLGRTIHIHSNGGRHYALEKD